MNNRPPQLVIVLLFITRYRQFSGGKQVPVSMVTPLLAFAPLAFFGWFMVRTLCRPEVPKLIHQPRPKPWLLLVGHLGLSPLFSMKWSSIWEYEQYVHVISLYVPTNLHSRTLCFSLLHHDKSARRSVKPHIFGYTKTIFSHEQCSKCLSFH